MVETEAEDNRTTFSLAPELYTFYQKDVSSTILSCTRTLLQNWWNFFLCEHDFTRFVQKYDRNALRLFSEWLTYFSICTRFIRNNFLSFSYIIVWSHVFPKVANRQGVETKVQPDNLPCTRIIIARGDDIASIRLAVEPPRPVTRIGQTREKDREGGRAGFRNLDGNLEENCSCGTRESG